MTRHQRLLLHTTIYVAIAANDASSASIASYYYV
jgi:hypothetical protein